MDLEYQGGGLGRELLLDALYRALELSQTSLGAVAVLLDALHDEAQRFDARYGFEQLNILDIPEHDEWAEVESSRESDPALPKRRLYLPTKSIARL